MNNKQPLAKRVQILSMLVEGSSMRSISRVVDVSINTVSALLVEAGKACAKHHDATVRSVRSKRVQCGAHALALYFTFYNFVRIHKTLRCSRAMAAGVTGRYWSMEDVVALIDARAEAPKARRPYKPGAPKLNATISN